MHVKVKATLLREPNRPYTIEELELELSRDHVRSW
jgi:hypothetical protein